VKIDVETQVTSSVVIQLDAEESDILAKVLNTFQRGSFADSKVCDLIDELWEMLPELDDSKYDYTFAEAKLVTEDE